MKTLIVVLIVSCFSDVAAFADYLDRDGILREDDGRIRLMTQYQAMGVDEDGHRLASGPACPSGTHLPTARELATISQSYGAEGIVEPSRGPNSRSYFYPIGFNPDGKLDAFYFSNAGYIKPQSDLGNFSFWSATTLSDEGHDATQILYGFNGGIYLEHRDAHRNVLCVRNQ